MRKTLISLVFVTGWLSVAPLLAEGPALEESLRSLVKRSRGKVGVCLIPSESPTVPVCSSGTERFPLQSVMKLVVAAAVFDAADVGKLSLSDQIEIGPEDGSPGPRAFIDLVRAQSVYRTSIEELVRRSVIDSDSTAVDRLIRHLGGIASIREFLRRKIIPGISIDRTERELQAESAGLSWEPGFADPDRFDHALSLLSDKQRDQAWQRHLTDLRDTATPEGMVQFLSKLSRRQLLSSSATEHLLNIMEETATGADRLKAGLPKGWRLAHKTGTGRRWKGLTETTNDVGILITPAGRYIPVAVFVAHSPADNEAQAAVIAEVARLCVRHCQEIGNTALSSEKKIRVEAETGI